MEIIQKGFTIYLAASKKGTGIVPEKKDNLQILRDQRSLRSFH